MPCYDGRDDCRIETRIVYREGIDPSWKVEAERLSERCKLLTDLLCKAGRARVNKTDIPPEVLSWWDEHCEIDRQHGEPW